MVMVMDVGRRLGELRKSRRLSQGDLERRTGLLRCYTSRVENAHTIPNIETIEKYAIGLGVPLLAFFSKMGRSASSGAAIGFRKSTIAFEIKGAISHPYARGIFGGLRTSGPAVTRCTGSTAGKGKPMKRREPDFRAT